MRMLGARIDVQRTHLVAAKRTARDHAFDGFLKNALREAALELLARSDLLDASGIARVLVVDLLV